MFNPIEMRRRMVQERIEKSFDNEIEKAHKDGDMHPNGKWVWVSSAAGGKGDWRTINGRAHQKHNAAQGSASGGNTPKDKGYAEKFKKNFKDASDDVLNKVISGKIQGTDADKRLAKEILDERKSSAEGEKYAAKIIDLLKVSSSKYSDIKKVTAFKTDKGNWAIDYDGANTGLIIGKDHLSEAELKSAGVKIEGANNEKKGVKSDAKIDETTIDQSTYDSAYKTATSKEETESHLKESLQKIDKNITEVKNAMSSASSATLGKLQKMLTSSVSKKKAIEDALKNFQRTDSKDKSAEEKKGEKANQTLTTDEKYIASSLAGKLVGNEWSKPMKWSEIFDKVAKFSDAQVNHFAISAIYDALNADGGDERNEYLKGAEDAMAELKYSRKKKDVSIVNYLNTAFDGYTVGGSLSDDKKKELDKFVNSSNRYKKSDIEKELNEATPEELKYIMVNALNYKVSSFKGGDMKGINHIIQEGVHKIRKNERLLKDELISWYMLFDKDSEKPKNGSSKSDNFSENPFSKYEDNGK